MYTVHVHVQFPLHVLIFTHVHVVVFVHALYMYNGSGIFQWVSGPCPKTPTCACGSDPVHVHMQAWWIQTGSRAAGGTFAHVHVHVQIFERLNCSLENYSFLINTDSTHM